MIAIRFAASAVVGVIVTLVLFYIMQTLIATGEKALQEDNIGSLVDFVRVKQEQNLERKQRKPKKPPPPDEPPPEIPPQDFNVAVDSTGYSMASIEMNVQADIGGGGFGISDGEYLPIVKVQPQYPRRAQQRGMSGWVILEFIVNSQGAVMEPVVVNNCAWIKNPRAEGECEDNPSSIFDRAATKAALKFKYKPKVVDGNPVDTAGVLHKITFEMMDE